MIRWLATLLDRFVEWMVPMAKINDQLWADELADFDLTAPASPRAGVAVRPADEQPAQVTFVGGPLKSDEQVIEELVADYREFVRDCFKQRRG